ncbi:MAG: acyl-CoA dehydrogenase family protein [Burkholderiaceae bacterium]|nr:acyl-CoA dehydrogenase family protein [Burkholderiaceae bacterium]
MNFDLNPDQEMLRETVSKWLGKNYTFEDRNSIIKAGGFSTEIWKNMSELGLMGLAVPEEYGGMDFGPVEAMLVMEQLGQSLVLEPYADVALIAAGLLRDHAAASIKQTWLPGLANGLLKVVLAHVEYGSRYDLAFTQARAHQKEDAWLVSGRKSVVPLGDQVDAFIVPAIAHNDGSNIGISLFLVERPAVGVTTWGYSQQDGARAAEVSLNNAPATLLVGETLGLAALEHAVDIGIAALCAQAVGAMDALFAMTVEYLNTRKQFGVPIGTFQALRHRIADVKIQIELARSMSYLATLKLREDSVSRRRALSAAKVQLGHSMRFVGQQCIQMHGGIGMTQEYAAGHYFKRLTCIELSFGDTLHHLAEVSARMQDTAGVFN